MTRPPAGAIVGARPGQDPTTVMSGEFQIVLCTCPDEASADAIATALLERRLAACVNLVPGITSLYRWRGELQRDAELLLLIKTRSTHFAAIRDTVRSMHGYELPELLAVPIQQGDDEYLQWLNDETS